MLSFALVVVLSSSSIEVRWSSAGKVERAVVVLDTLSQVEREQADVQYERSLRCKGVPLAQLVGKVQGEGDLVVAHFQNGMVVPLPDAKGLELSLIHI